MAAIEDDEVSVNSDHDFAAKALARDHDFAFNLQMQEALAISREANTSSVPEYSSGGYEDFDFTSIILEDIARVDQERRDREFGEQEMKRLKVDLDRRIHDQKFDKEIMSIPEGDWSKHGDNYEKPYSLGAGASSSSSSSPTGDESFRVYCKGLVSEEMIGDTRAMVGGVALAICDSTDNLIWEVKKVLGAEESSKSPEIAELEALVHGLDQALTFDLGRVTFFIDHFKVFQYVSDVYSEISQLSLLKNLNFCVC